MRQDLQELVPYSLRVDRASLLVNLQQLPCHWLIDSLQIFGDQQLNNEHILLEIPATLDRHGPILVLVVNESLAEVLYPSLDLLQLQLVANRVVAHDNVDNYHRDILLGVLGFAELYQHSIGLRNDTLMLLDCLDDLVPLLLLNFLTLKQVLDHFHDVLDGSKLLLQFNLFHGYEWFGPVPVVDELHRDIVDVCLDEEAVGSTLL